MLPDLSVFWVIFFVLVLTAVLNTLLLQPLRRVMGEREQRDPIGARAGGTVRGRSASRNRRVRPEDGAGARRDLPADGRDAEGGARRARRNLGRTRAEAEAEVAQATATLKAEAEEARRRLAADAEALGAAAADRILGRKAS